jgi:type IV pilus assembly protein PilM
LLFPKASVSIDIGSQNVKVAQLTEGRGGVGLIRCAEQPLPAGFRWEIGADRRPLVEAIRTALARAGIRRQTAVFALPRRQVTARISAYPPADRAALRRVIEYDLAEHIPFPVEQVVLDFQPLGPSREQPGLTDVLVVAAQRDLVRQYLELARELGIRATALTVDALALHDLLRLIPEGPPGVTLVVEVGARATTINVAEGRRLRLTRSVGLGGQQLTLAVRDDLGVSAEQAEEMKLAQGFALLTRDPQPHRTAAWLENLRGELRRSALSSGPTTVSRFFLTGAGSVVPGLEEAIRSDFAVTPVRLSASALFPNARLMGEGLTGADHCLLAMAQALHGLGRSGWTISLVPREVVEQRRARQLRRVGVAAMALVVVGMAAGYVLGQRSLGGKRAEVAVLERRAKAAEKTQAQAKRLTGQRDRLRAELAVLEPARARRYASLELLRVLSEAAPPGVVLTSFTQRPGQPLEIQGTAPSSDAVADLQAALARSRLVTRVSLGHADQMLVRSQTRPGAAATEAISFSLTIHLWTERVSPPRASTLARAGVAQ